MIRVTIDLIPGGIGTPRTIGIVEIANMVTRLDGTADYGVVLKKSPPFEGALRLAWKKGRVSSDDRSVTRLMAGEDEELITAVVEGHHRSKRGVYDLLYRALQACGLDGRLPRPVSDPELMEPREEAPKRMRAVASPIAKHAYQPKREMQS